MATSRKHVEKAIKTDKFYINGFACRENSSENHEKQIFFLIELIALFGGSEANI